MADGHSVEHRHGTGVTAYLVIFGALVIFTTVSFIVNGMVRGGSLSKEAGFTIIMGVAVCKAVLVAIFFMHLLFDWKRLFFMIIPVMILGSLLVIVLLPDIVLGWHH